MILVTGAGGFIGKWVMKQLTENGKEVAALVRDAGKYGGVRRGEMIIEAALDDLSSATKTLQSLPIDTCIHLAWEGIPDYSYGMSKKNLQHGLEVLDLCRECGINNLVITGSCWEYKNPVGKISTEWPLDVSNSFKAAKNSLHAMAHAFCCEHDIHLNWLRLFYVYGPGQRNGSLIPTLINSFRKGEQPRLNGIYNENDFVYVGDVADAVVKCATNHGYPENLNVGSGKAVKVLDVAKLVAAEFGMDFHGDHPDEQNSHTSKSFYADGDEMLRQYGWYSETDMVAGIKEILKLVRWR